MGRFAEAVNLQTPCTIDTSRASGAGEFYNSSNGLGKKFWAGINSTCGAGAKL